MDSTTNSAVVWSNSVNEGPVVSSIYPIGRAASIPALRFTGAPYSSGTGTTTLPLLLFSPNSATAATNWSVNGTVIGANVATAFNGNYLDFRKNGGNSEVYASPGGIVGFNYLNQTNGNIAHTCTMSSATSCTYSLSNAFVSTPVCVATPNGTTATSQLSWACSVSGTTVTVTASASNSLTWNVITIGNPN